MSSWPVRCTLICLCLAQITLAQEFKLWNRKVQVHGFFSQGFVYTDHNNWLTMNTRQGSGAMTDMGLNMSSQLTDKFRVGAQVYDRNLGQLGQWHPSLDWAVADYRFRNWFGVRAGKVKTILGLYNDSQDLDFLHVFALLPQGVYPADMRDTTIAHRGADVYGSFPLLHRIGEFGYTAYAGYQNNSIYSGYPYLARQYGAFFREVPGSQYGADLRWNTPWKGLMMGASRVNQEVTAKGQYRSDLYLPTGSIPYQTSTKAYWTNQFYGEYIWHKLRLDAEYRRYFVRYPILPGSDVGTDVRAWYIAGSYRVWKYLQVGSYYSRYTILSDCGGLAAAFIPPQTDTSLPQNHVYDKVLAARFDLNHFLYLKLEGHFINGYGLGPYPDGFYPQQNPTGFKPNTVALVVKTGFRF